MNARIMGHALLTLCVLIPSAAPGAEPSAFVETEEMMQPDPDAPRAAVVAGQLRRSLEAGRDALLNADAHTAFVHLNKALFLSKTGGASLNWQISDYKMQDEIQHGTAVGGVMRPQEDSVLTDILFEIEQAKPLAGKKLDQDALFVAGQEAITTGYQRDVQAREKAQDMKEKGKKLKDRQKKVVEDVKTLYVAAGGKGGGAGSGEDDGGSDGPQSGVRVVNTSAEGGGGGGGSDDTPPDGKRPPDGKKDKSGKAAGGKGGGGGGSPSGKSKAGGKSGQNQGDAKGGGKPSGKGEGGQGQGKGGGDLAGQQEDVAKAASNMAGAAKGLSGLDSRFGGMSQQLGEAAERAFQAAGRMRAGDKAAGLREAEKALKHMEEAMKGLDPIILERLAANLKALQLTARELYQRQGSLRRKTEKLADAADDMYAAALQRDTKVQRIAQVRIHKGLGELTVQINKAAAAASEMKRTAAVKALRSAQRTALRGPQGADQKMRNAVVRLEAAELDAAAGEMMGAEEALKAFLDDITAAGLDLTPGSAAAIARAEQEAGRIGQGLAHLTGKPYAGGAAQSASGQGDGKGGGDSKSASGQGDGKGGGDSKSASGQGDGKGGGDSKSASGQGDGKGGGDSKSASGQGDGKGGGDSKSASGKGDGKGGGDSKSASGQGDGKGGGDSKSASGKGDGKGGGDSKSASGQGDGKGGQGSGSGGGRRDGEPPEQVTVTSASGGKGGHGLGQPDGPGARLTGEPRRRAASRLAFRIKNWVWEMKDVNIVPDERLAALEAIVADGAGLEARLEDDSAAAVEMMAMVADVHTYLAQLRKSRASAERLKAARREECPPAYRPLVSEYFKALASPEAR
ncbi:MAG: hypothetical protein KGY99_09925 [Phycisphaerae bacterium]|nr:hypothetical protein [Phycisphaerae bacterium]